MIERARKALLLGGLGLFLGCSAEEVPVTELVVVVDSDVPTAQIEYIEIEVSDRDGEPMPPYPIVIDEDKDMPVQFGIVHKGGKTGPVTITARGRLSDKYNEQGRTLVATRTHEVHFVEKQTLVVPLHLMKGCFVPGDTDPWARDTDPCAGNEDGEQCAGDGVCVPTKLPKLASYPIDPIKKGPGFDGGSPMGGDGGPPDGSPGDAGGDAGIDASTIELCDSIPVDTATNRFHCGGCDMPCTDIDDETQNIAGVCVDSKCKAGCAQDWGDCDGNATLECTTDLLTTKEHCGGCNPSPPCTGGNKECVEGKCVNK